MALDLTMCTGHFRHYHKSYNYKNTLYLDSKLIKKENKNL